MINILYILIFPSITQFDFIWKSVQNTTDKEIMILKFILKENDQKIKVLARASYVISLLKLLGFCTHLNLKKQNANTFSFRWELFKL